MSYDRYLRLKEAEQIVEKNEKGKVKKRKMTRKHDSMRKKKSAVYVLTSNREFDFLKYYGIIELWALDRYKIKRGVLFTLLGLYQEGTFNNKQFELFARALDRNYPRLIQWYIDNGYIKEVDIMPYAKKANRSVSEVKLMGKMYKLTYMSNLMIQEIYRRLVMRMPIPENIMVHSLDKTQGHTNKRYRIENLVKGFNAKQTLVSEMSDASRIEDDYLFMKKTMVK